MDTTFHGAPSFWVTQPLVLWVASPCIPNATHRFWVAWDLRCSVWKATAATKLRQNFNPLQHGKTVLLRKEHISLQRCNTAGTLGTPLPRSAASVCYGTTCPTHPTRVLQVYPDNRYQSASSTR